MVERLMSIIRHLRSPKGCPWDRKQTFGSLRAPLLEETYEVIEAIDKRRRNKLAEELGDLLCVIFMIIAIGEDRRLWKKDTIVKRAEAKMRRRHPHVFGSSRAKTPEDALRVWTRAKRTEQSKQNGILSGRRLRGSFPALLEADKIQSFASREGFDWKYADNVLDKIEEEISELREACTRRHPKYIEDEIGDLLFSIVNFGRKMGIVSELALHNTNKKFCKRFELMENYLKRNRRSMKSMKLRELDKLWTKAKQAHRRARGKS